VNLLRPLKRLWKRQKAEAGPLSIVLLQRESHLFTREELEQAGERAWGKKFGGDEDPMYFVAQTGAVTFVKAGSDVMNVLQARQPYLEKSAEVLRELPEAAQRRAVLEHNAWAAIDSLTSRGTKAEVYACLAGLALQLGNENCCGVFLPAENLLAANDGSAEKMLHMLMRKEIFR
jgi:hypothetical protein